MEWISVKDRLPEVSGFYLVCWGSDSKRLEEVEYSAIHKKFNTKDHMAKEEAEKRGYKRVTHWMKPPALEQWNSVEMKMPEVSGEYLTLMGYGQQVIVQPYSAERRLFLIETIMTDGDRDKQESHGVYPITHWLPLPALPANEEAKGAAAIAADPADTEDEDELLVFPLCRDTGMEWICVKDRLPEVSGRYLVCWKDGSQKAADYSTIHKKFNTRDYQTKEEAEKSAYKGVAHWMEQPALEKWNSVEEKMPKKSGKYLVLMGARHHMMVYTYLAERKLLAVEMKMNDAMRESMESIGMYPMTHWLPLPVPPAGEGTDAGKED